MQWTAEGGRVSDLVPGNAEADAEVESGTGSRPDNGDVVDVGSCRGIKFDNVRTKNRQDQWSKAHTSQFINFQDSRGLPPLKITKF